jgi:SAM-dependent methyltransferase
MRCKTWSMAAGLVLALTVAFESQASWSFPDGPLPGSDLDVPYVPTPRDVVDEMLRLADLDSDDLLYDLGSGDGRIVIAAAKQYGVRGVGIDLDPERIRESRANARAAGVTDLVEFIEGDLFDADLREATAVTLYLLSSVNLKVRPKLLRELRPGTPVVSHAFDMGEWRPDRTVEVDRRTVYLWIVPADVEGSWSVSIEGRGNHPPAALFLEQKFQAVKGTAYIDGEQARVESGRLDGEAITFEVRLRKGGTRQSQIFEGRVNGDFIEGSVIREGDRPVPASWTARRSRISWADGPPPVIRPGTRSATERHPGGP